jgi:hypothetical protein
MNDILSVELAYGAWIKKVHCEIHSTGQDRILPRKTDGILRDASYPEEIPLLNPSSELLDTYKQNRWVQTCKRGEERAKYNFCSILARIELFALFVPLF